MPIYTWSCHECELYWEREYKMGKAPEKTKCPGCEKRKGRCYDIPTLRFLGPGFYVNDYGRGNWAHKSQQGAVDEFVRDSETASKKRMKSGFQNYRVYTPDYEVLEKKGEIKKSSSSVNANAARHREMAKHIYKNAEIDPTKQEKPNVDIMTRPDKEGLE